MTIAENEMTTATTIPYADADHGTVTERNADNQPPKLHAKLLSRDTLKNLDNRRGRMTSANTPIVDVGAGRDVGVLQRVQSGFDVVLI
jgi:hypothetical protein